MRMYYFALIFAALITSCNKNVPVNTPDAAHVAVPADSLLPADCIPENFTTPMGTKVTYTRVGNAVRLSWGNGSYVRSHDSLFTCTDSYYHKYRSRWDWIPKYESETKNYLVFKNVLSTSSGQNPAPIDFSAIILPKNATDSIYEIDMYIDKQDDYLLYSVGCTGDSLCILNLETKRMQLCNFHPDPPPFNRSPTFVVHKAKITRHKLEVLYETLDKNDSIVLVKNKFDLHI